MYWIVSEYSKTRYFPSTFFIKMKPGDIFKIIRPSFTAGKNIFYRRVVNGSVDILFSS